MAQSFKETAHLKTDLKAYGENYDHIFKKYSCNCHLVDRQVCDTCQKTKANQDQSNDRIVVEEFGPCDL